jgi:hypothetical protein
VISDSLSDGINPAAYAPTFPLRSAWAGSTAAVFAKMTAVTLLTGELVSHANSGVISLLPIQGVVPSGWRGGNKKHQARRFVSQELPQFIGTVWWCVLLHAPLFQRPSPLFLHGLQWPNLLKQPLDISPIRSIW